MLHRFLVALTVLMLAAPAFASERGPAPIDAAPAARLSAPAKTLGAACATSAERSRYAAREAASPEAKQYRGGADVVIVSASALAVIVLAVVLLVVLL